MKKIIILLAVVAAVLFGGNVYYTYKASEECRVVLRMTHNMENNGTIGSERAAHYYCAIAKSRNVMYPVNTLARLQRIRKNLQREAHEHDKNCAMGGQYEYAITSRLNYGRSEP